MSTQPSEGSEPRSVPIAAGCLFALGSTLVTCLLLLVNGVLLSMLYASFAHSGPPILQNQQIVQFILFVSPVVLVIIEWMMIDLVVSRLRRRS